MRELKLLIWFGVFVLVGMLGITFARVVEDSPRLQAVLKSSIHADSFYMTVQ